MRFGIVGTNFISDRFVSSAVKTDGAELYGVTSGHYENAAAFAEKYAIPHIYSSLQEMLSDDQIEAVYLATPNSMHYEQTLQCIEAGKHVMTEKPFTPAVRQAEQLFAAAERKHVYVHDALVPMYGEGIRVMKQELKRCGRIRRAVFSISQYSSRFDAYLEGRNPTTFRRELCNGAWMDLGVYALSCAAALFGKPGQILAVSQLLDTGADVTSSAFLRYEGFDAVITCSKAALSEMTCEIGGENGTLILDHPNRTGKVWFTDRRTKEKTLLFEAHQDDFVLQLEDFIENVQSGRTESERLPHALTLDIIGILETCRKQSGVIYPCDEEE